MKMRIKIKDKLYDIEISPGEDGEIKIKVGDKEFNFKESGAQVSAAGKKKPTVAQAYLPQKKNFGEREIKSPLAGIVSKIFIDSGMEVKKGDKVLLLSAMKMENEIISEFQGRVKEIRVKENQQVKAGEILIVLT